MRPCAFLEMWIDILRSTASRSGRPLVFGRGDNPISFVSVRDVAALLAAAVLDPGVQGRSLDLGGPEDLTFTELAMQVQRADGRTGAPRHVPPAALRLAAQTVGRLSPGVGRKVRAALAMDSSPLSFDSGGPAGGVPRPALHDGRAAARRGSWCGRDLEARAPRAGGGVADDLALLVGLVAQLAPGTRSSSAAGRGRPPRGCVRRAGRRCGRCRRPRWRPGRRRASARWRAASPCRRGTSAAPARRSPAAASPRRACPGRWAAPPAPAMITLRPAPGRLAAVGEHLVGHPVRGDDVGLGGHAELLAAPRPRPASPASRSRSPSRCRPDASLTVLSQLAARTMLPHAGRASRQSSRSSP